MSTLSLLQRWKTSWGTPDRVVTLGPPPFPSLETPEFYYYWALQAEAVVSQYERDYVAGSEVIKQLMCTTLEPEAERQPGDGIYTIPHHTSLNITWRPRNPDGTMIGSYRVVVIAYADDLLRNAVQRRHPEDDAVRIVILDGTLRDSPRWVRMSECAPPPPKSCFVQQAAGYCNWACCAKRLTSPEDIESESTLIWVCTQKGTIWAFAKVVYHPSRCIVPKRCCIGRTFRVNHYLFGCFAG